MGFCPDSISAVLVFSFCRTPIMERKTLVLVPPPSCYPDGRCTNEVGPNGPRWWVRDGPHRSGPRNHGLGVGHVGYVCPDLQAVLQKSRVRSRAKPRENKGIRRGGRACFANEQGKALGAVFVVGHSFLSLCNKFPRRYLTLAHAHVSPKPVFDQGGPDYHGQSTTASLAQARAPSN